MPHLRGLLPRNLKKENIYICTYLFNNTYILDAYLYKYKQQ